MRIIGNRYNLITPIQQDNEKYDSDSKVYIGKDLKSKNQTVAVKILELENDNESDLKNELFRREYISLSRLNHKSIIKYKDSGRDENLLYLVMEFYDGHTLNKYLKDNEINIEEKIKIAIKIAEALAYAHEKGVIHRDLKPNNIMINNPDDIRIIDFGISKIINYKYNSQKTMKCFMTIRYAAPEQLLRLEANTQSDIYSFGLNLAYLLSEEEPPEERNNIDSYISNIKCSRELKSLLFELLDSNLEKRSKSMYSVKRALEKEYNLIRAKTKKLYIKFNSYIQRKLIEQGMLDYSRIEHTKKFILNDLNESYIYRNVKQGLFYVIGKNIKYCCKLLKNKKGLEITNIYCIDDQIDWEREINKGIKINLPWIPINTENDIGEDSYLEILIQEIIDKEKYKENEKDRKHIKSQLLDKWNRYLQEEFNEIDHKRRVCKYSEFTIDESGYRIYINIDELEYEIKSGEIVQMTDNNNNQVTVGEFDEIIDKKMSIRLTQDINPSNLSKRGIIGIDVVQSRNNLKRLARALNAIKLSTSTNPNLGDILAEPSIITMNNNTLINKNDFIQEILRQSPESDNANAVRKALGVKDLYLIQGPPGTGKSTVITEIACQILKEDPEAKILLTSQSHVAVDHLVNKVASLLPDKRIIRIGRSEKISAQSQNLIMSEQLNKWVDNVKAESIYGLESYINKNLSYSGSIVSELEGRERENNQDINDQNETDDLKAKKLIRLTREWHRRLGRLEEFDEIFANKASIIAATCLGIASRNILNDMDFDWVIVDEAARATPLELLVPIVRGKKIILVGDHRQLPPVFNTNLNKLKLVERGIKESDLETSLFEDLYKKMPDEAKLVLTTQFRMHPDISRLVSDVFYPTINITTTIKEEDRNHNLDWWPKSIKWIDTSNCKECNETDELLSKKNLLEARVILEELDKIESIYRTKDIKSISVSVISGYNAQKNLLNNLIKPNDNKKWTRLKIIIDNVDAFQGSETDIVIYSLVRCNDEHKIGFLYDERRLNVALSRGKSCVIIVGNKEFAEKARSIRGNPLVDIIKYMRKNSNSSLIEVYYENKRNC